MISVFRALSSSSGVPAELLLVFKAKNNVSSGKHNERLSVKIQSICALRSPNRFAPRTFSIFSIELDIVLILFEGQNTGTFLSSCLSLTLFELKNYGMLPNGHQKVYDSTLCVFLPTLSLSAVSDC